MIRRLPFTVALLIVLLPNVASAQRGAAPNPERAAVQQLITRFGELLQARDMDAIEPLFRAGGVHILTDSATTHGWDEYRDQYLKPELDAIQDLRYAHAAVEAVVRDTVAWVAFRREISGAAMAAVQGRGTAVLEKVDGKWVIVHLHMSR